MPLIARRDRFSKSKVEGFCLFACFFVYLFCLGACVGSNKVHTLLSPATVPVAKGE